MNTPQTATSGSLLPICSAKLRLEIELEYDANLMHGDDTESKQWFMSHILSERGGDLLLHSNEIGDTIGPVVVIRVLPNNKDGTTN
jgi:hypothetical protein